MIAFPPSKINLGLNVIRKREDGYHDIETCFYPVPWTDIVEVIPSDTFAFTQSGLDIPGSANNNLCIEAYELLRQPFHLPPVKIHLHKIIPTGAGLGGGSSDAAHVLNLLNNMFQLGLTTLQVKEYASVLGSDCAFFVESVPAMGSGRGEVLAPVSLSLQGMFLVLVKPHIHVSTAEAYAGVQPKVPSQKLQEIIHKPVALWKDLLVNDFEPSVFKKYPVIAEIKNSLYNKGAVYAAMSGSGASVFGIFNNETNLEKHFPGSTYWSGWL